MNLVRLFSLRKVHELSPLRIKCNGTIYVTVSMVLCEANFFLTWVIWGFGAEANHRLLLINLGIGIIKNGKKSDLTKKVSQG